MERQQPATLERRPSFAARVLHSTLRWLRASQKRARDIDKATIQLSRSDTDSITLLRLSSTPSELHLPPQRRVPDSVLAQLKPLAFGNQRKTRAEWWVHWQGELLEPALASGAVALLDAGWLLKLAQSGRDARIQPLQALPYEAFVSIDELRAETDGGFHLPIIVLSYTWLHPLHPDPNGETLRLLGRLLPAFIRRHARWGVFWDVASLLQHPDASNGVLRSAAEEVLFRDGLASLAAFFAHQYTYVLRATAFPPRYPEGYDVPEGANTAPYMERGWPYVETCWAAMTKSSARCFDVGGVTQVSDDDDDDV